MNRITSLSPSDHLSAFSTEKYLNLEQTTSAKILSYSAAHMLCKLYENVNCSVVSDSLQPHGLQPTRLLSPWDIPGKNTGVGCHFLLQRIFPTQGSNPGLPHCRQMLYCLSYQGRLYEVSLNQAKSPLFISYHHEMTKPCMLIQSIHTTAISVSWYFPQGSWVQDITIMNRDINSIQSKIGFT